MQRIDIAAALATVAQPARAALMLEDIVQFLFETDQLDKYLAWRNARSRAALNGRANQSRAREQAVVPSDCYGISLAPDSDPEC